MEEDPAATAMEDEEDKEIGYEEILLQGLTLEAMTHNDRVTMDRFLKIWDRVKEKYQQEEETERLLVFLQQLGQLQLGDICDRLDFFLVSTLTLDILEREEWLPELKDNYLKIRFDDNFSFLSVEDKTELCQAVRYSDWNCYLIDRFMDAMKADGKFDNARPFLALVKKYNISMSIILPLVLQNKITMGNMLANLATAIVRSKYQQLTEPKLLSFFRQIDPSIVLTPLMDLLQLSSEPETFVKHIEDVLYLLTAYGMDSVFCSNAFKNMKDKPADTWLTSLHKKAVDHIFSGAKIRDNVGQLIQEISDKSTCVKKDVLEIWYDETLVAYRAISEKVPLIKKCICEWGKKEVSMWASTIKSEMKPSIPQAELLAVIMRAVELQHDKITPRPTQLLTVMLLLNPVAENRGRLAQVNTGEGKSLIVAMLAAAHALRGELVDIITTSTELTIPEVAKQKPFFALLGLSVGENSRKENESESREVYGNNVVYGTDTDFLADILRTEYLARDIRSNRPFKVAIVDEADSMLYDNRLSSVRLSSLTPAMDHLEVALGAIWQMVILLQRRLIQYEGKLCYVTEDFEERDGKLRLLNVLDNYVEKDGEERHFESQDLEEHLILVEDARKFITEETKKHLVKLLRKLDATEKAEQQEYEKLESQCRQVGEEIASLDREIEIAVRKEDELKQEKVNIEQMTPHMQQIPPSLLFLPLEISMTFMTKEKLTQIIDNQITTNAKEKKRLDGKRSPLAVKQSSLLEKRQKSPWLLRYQVLDIPRHLRNFAIEQIDPWIKNAICARNDYHKDKHYAFENGSIVPIDYSNTGVLQHNTVWGDGLAQFLQIKEGLKVRPESISNNSMSNINLFSRYSHLFGLTGTLGDEPTKNFLQEVYKVDDVTIPPYRQQVVHGNDENSRYLCKELQAIVVTTPEEWYQTICHTAVMEAGHGRGVLIICKYIDQVNELEKRLKQIYKSEKIFTYTGEGNGEDASMALPDDVICSGARKRTKFTKKTIEAGEIIIATNISGRGTDITPSKEVEEHGGMHVYITFLPETSRVEQQNAGRTARQGRKGTAQLVLHSASSPECLRKERYLKEVNDSQKAKEGVKRMVMQDRLFQHYCSLESKWLPRSDNIEKMERYEFMMSEWERNCKKNTAQDIVEHHFQIWVQQKVKEQVMQYTTQFSGITEKEVEDLQQELVKKLIEAESVHKSTIAKGLEAKIRVEFHHKIQQSQQYSPDLIECFLQGKKFIPVDFETAAKYDWGESERRGLQESWGLFLHWLLHQNQQDKQSLEEKAAYEAFDEFKLMIDKRANQDELIQNPYYFVQKGNDCSDSDKAIITYDRAIKLDPDFALSAHYNKACSLLGFKNNAGDRQQSAREELQAASRLIEERYKPAIMSFHGFLDQTGVQQVTSQHVQHQLNILCQQSNYISAAIKIIDEALVNGWDVKLTQKRLGEIMGGDEEDYKQAILEANANGLINLFTIELKKPIPWKDIMFVALIGLVQIGIGGLMIVYSGGTLGLHFIRAGVSDLIAAVKAGITGSFSWAEWAMQKVISLVVSISCAALKGIKDGFQAVKSGVQQIGDTVKGVLTTTTGTLTKEGLKQATKEVGLALGKGVATTLATELVNFGVDKLLLEDIERHIGYKVTEQLTKALSENELVQRGLALDAKNGNNYWQERFIQMGQELLKDDKSKLAEFADGVARGLVTGTYESAGRLLQAADAMEMCVKLATLTDDFIAKFNEKVEKKKSSIAEDEKKAQNVEANSEVTKGEKDLSKDTLTINSKQQQQKQPQQSHHREDVQVEKTMAPPPVDTSDIKVHVVGQGNAYKSSAPTSKSQGLKDHLYKPSNLNDLCKYFDGQITGKLTSCVKKNVHTITNELTTMGVGNVFSSIEANVTESREKYCSERKVFNINNKAATTAAGKNKQLTPAEVETARSKLSKEERSLVDKVCDDSQAQGIEALGLRSQALQRPIKVFDKNGNLVEIVGKDLPGEPMGVQFVPSDKPGDPGHWQVPSSVAAAQQQRQTGANTCLDDALHSQLPADNGQFSTPQDLKDAARDCALQNPKMIKELVSAEKNLRHYNFEALKEGGFKRGCTENEKQNYVDTLKRITRGKYDQQLNEMKDQFENTFDKLPKPQKDDHSDKYSKKELVAEWERHYGQKWPRDENGKEYILHHIIQQDHGGPHDVRNSIPVSPAQHKEIHSSGGAASRVFYPHLYYTKSGTARKKWQSKATEEGWLHRT